MATPYTATIEVNVTDREKLRGQAIRKAMAINEIERFFEFEAKAYEDDSEINYWIEWVFGNKAPDDSGFEITTIDVDAVPI